MGSPQIPSFLQIAAVSYEGSLFGWDVTADEGEAGGLETRMTFGFHCTAGSLRVVAVSGSGKYMCCGGMDERIHVFNVQDKRAIGEVSGHTGAITSLAFVGDSFLISGSEDTTLCIWRVYDWQCLHVLGGHKLGINSVAVHPSGKLALSTSKDNTLKTWNLVHGRCGFTRRLRGPADKVLWHQGGEYYLLVVGSELQLYNVADNNSCAASFSFGSRINQAVFTQPEAAGVREGIFIAVVCENKFFHVVSASGEKLTGDGVDLTSVLDGGRPRDMWSCRAAAVGGDEMQEIMRDEGDTISIVTSDGLLTILSCRALCHAAASQDSGEESDLAHSVLSSIQTTAQPRLTAVCAWAPSPPKQEGDGSFTEKKKSKKQLKKEREREREREREGEAEGAKKRVRFQEEEAKGKEGSKLAKKKGGRGPG